MRHRAAVFALLPLVFAPLTLVAVGCSGSPSEPAARSLELSSATVSVNGKVYNGQTFHSSQGHGTATRFEARLRYRDGSAADGAQLWIEPRHGAGMMGGGGRFLLYDDGTHGDQHPGDGLYCFEDFDGQYGFHHAGAQHGQYHYDFWGEHPMGGESNHLGVTVDVDD